MLVGLAVSDGASVADGPGVGVRVAGVTAPVGVATSAVAVASGIGVGSAEPAVGLGVDPGVMLGVEVGSGGVSADSMRRSSTCASSGLSG